MVNHFEWRVYQLAFEAAMQVFDLSHQLPEEERLLLTHPIIRSSRSVCACMAMAWRKQRNLDGFVSKLYQAEAAIAETQTWLEFVVVCRYVHPEVGRKVYWRYMEILAELRRVIEGEGDQPF